MRISEKEVFVEEAQGQILLQNNGTSVVTIDGTGAVGLGTASSKVGLFGATPVVVQATTATTGTFTAGTGTAAVSGSSWVGNVGTKSYSMSDVVTALKNVGILTS